MSPEEWLTSTDPAAMLEYIGRGCDPTGLTAPRQRVSDRRLRLFACACYFDVKESAMPIAGENIIRAINTSMEWAETGIAPKGVREHSIPEDIHDNPIDHALSAAQWSAYHRGSRTLEQLGRDQAVILREIVGNPWKPVTLPTIAPHKQLFQCPHCCYPGRYCSMCHGTTKVEAACRDCFDKKWIWIGQDYLKWMPCNKCPKPTCPWITPTVKALATAAYEERHEDGTLDNDRLAVLADALEDAGCPEMVECPECENGFIEGQIWVGATDSTSGQPVQDFTKCEHCGGTSHVPNPILTHLRSEGPHVRGCHVLDLLIGKG